MKEKICRICKKSKELDMFGSNRTRPDKHCTECRECRKVMVRDIARRMALANPSRRVEYYAKNRDRELASAKRSAELHKDRIKSYLKKYQKRNAYKLKAQYKLRYAVYKGIVKRIDVCEICGVFPSQKAHHYDYSKVFDVVWVCGSCHKGIHKGRIRQDLNPDIAKLRQLQVVDKISEEKGDNL